MFAILGNVKIRSFCPVECTLSAASSAGADDNLRVSRSKKKAEGITQGMVDRRIQEEVAEFLGGILSQSAGGPGDGMDHDTDTKKRKKRKMSQDMHTGPNRVRSPPGSSGAGDVSELCFRSVNLGWSLDQYWRSLQLK